MAISTPIVNAGEKYITGLLLGWTSGTVITVGAGQARDFSNRNDLILETGVSIDSAVIGVNGLDIGVLANDTLYGVYIIGDSYKNYATACIMSADLTAPLMPFGYNMYRRVGFVLTSGAAAILKFYQRGNGPSRWMWYDAAIEALAAGASAAYATVNLSDFVPPEATTVLFNAILTPTGNGDTAHIQPTGATAADGYCIIGGAQAGVAFNDNMICPCSAAPEIDYKVTGTLTLNLRAYEDML